MLSHPQLPLPLPLDASVQNLVLWLDPSWRGVARSRRSSSRWCETGMRALFAIALNSWWEAICNTFG